MLRPYCADYPLSIARRPYRALIAPRAGLFYRGELGHNKEIRAAGLSEKDAKT